MALGPSLLPMKVPESAAADVAEVSPQNPATDPVEEQWMQLDLSEEDIDHTVKIITMYRNQWGTDRLERMRVWMRNVLFYRGIQVLVALILVALLTWLLKAR